MKLDIDFNKLSFEEIETIIKAVKKQKDTRTENLLDIPVQNKNQPGSKGRHWKKSKQHVWTVNEIETLIKEQKNGNTVDGITRLLGLQREQVISMIWRLKTGRHTQQMKKALKNTEPKKTKISFLG